MSLTVNRITLENGVEVMALTGSLTLGRDAQNFESSVEELVKDQKTRIVLDLSGVSFVDSAGIGILVGCHGKVSKAGGQFRLAGANDRVLNVLKITRVDSILLMDSTAAESTKAMSA